MENAIIKATPKNISFKSEKLNAVTVEIANYIDGAKRVLHNNQIATSRLLGRVATEKLYEEDGFKSALDYAMSTFEWKRAYAYAMISVGTKLNAGELPEGDFNIEQYRAIGTLPKEVAIEAVENGVITPEMTVREVKEEVEILKPKKERKDKPEKVYKWYLDAMPGRNDIEAPESIMASGDGCDGVQRVNFKFGENNVVGYLVAKDGQIRFYSRGEEVKPEVEGEATEVTEQATEAVEG